MNRRMFIKRSLQFVALLASFKLVRASAASHQHSASATGHPYGMGSYGQGSYPGYQTYLPLTDQFGGEHGAFTTS